MSAEREILEQYQDSTGTYFSDRREHTEVTVAVLYWQQCDLKAEGEIQRLRKVFEIDFKYHVLPDFVIPFAASAQQDLGLYLASVVRDWSKQPNTLIIVYYAGHCYYTEDGQDARWFAKKDNDRSLSWTSSGQCLFGAIGDVLVILDCCEAAVKLKGTKEQGRFELLAATARGVATPTPGKLSFTTFLISELRKRKTNGVTARDLSSFIWRHDDITQTPHWDDFALKGLESIPLRPLHQQSQLQAPQETTQPGFTLLSLSHDGQLTGYQLAEYLKTAVPAAITAVNIEALILKAKGLQKDRSLRAFPEGSLLYNLSDASKTDILRQVQRLDVAIQKSTNDAQVLAEEHKKELAIENLSSIQSAVSAVSTAIETPLLLGRDKEKLLQAFRIGSTSPDGISEMMALRRVLLESASKFQETSLELPRDRIDFQPGAQRFCRAAYDKDYGGDGTSYEKGSDVLLEFFRYKPDPGGKEPHRVFIDQIERITMLLHLKKRTEFRILPCLGYFHDKVRHRFGFVFGQHDQAEFTKLPIALSELYKDARYKFASLDDRLRLAHTLAFAVDHFHRIGWVHKELRSNNIFMIEAPKLSVTSPGLDGKIDAPMFSGLDGLLPWIFGFGFARTADGSTALEEDHDAENNKYRHPQRIGRPQKRFTRAYDVYALGVILFEVAQWKKVNPPVSDGRVQSQDVYEYIMQPQKRKELAFRTGTAFSSAITTCLNFDTSTEGMTELEEHRYFQHHVVEVLRKASESL